MTEPYIEAIGYCAAAAGLYSTYARTMIPLRAASIVANLLFIGYGLLKGIYPTILVNCLLLPLNFVRLRDMRRLITDVQQADETELRVDWLRLYLTHKAMKAGEVIWLMGDVADSAIYIFSGEVELVEIGTRVGPGELIGEMGLFNPSQKRMLSARCVADCDLGTISYDEFRVLYFQNPTFGFYLLRLVTTRLQDSFQKVVTPQGRQAFQTAAKKIAQEATSKSAKTET